MRASPHTPPTTPPAIAPVLFFLGPLTALEDGVEDGEDDDVAISDDDDI
jgi:hypothetical protein